MTNEVRVGRASPDPDAELADLVAFARTPLDLEPPAWRVEVLMALTQGKPLPEALAAASVPLSAWEHELRADVVFAREVRSLG